MKQLIVVSKSTEHLADEYFKAYTKVLVSEPPNENILDKDNISDDVIAIGGGAVIDTAKVLCSERVKAYPTTYSGASRTTHAVIWGKDKKISVETKKPITIFGKPINNKIDLPEEVEVYSKIDCLCHILEAFISPNATKLSNEYVKRARMAYLDGKYMIASFLAGDAIEITGTNIIHGLSYPLTYKYGIPHGKALATILHEALNIPKVKELL